MNPSEVTDVETARALTKAYIRESAKTLFQQEISPNETMKIEFKKLWYSSFYILVLHNWPARKFYEKHGWIYIDKKVEKLWDIDVSEVSYGWKDIYTPQANFCTKKLYDSL